MIETVRIAMWSGPRNISTAMMRAWESRSDCAVMDEPFYGAYLATTGLDHPMAEEIIAAHATDWDAIAETCATTDAAPIVYQKHMSQHMVADAPLDWMDQVCHTFLIRPPAEVAASFKIKWTGMGADDLGFARQAELFERIADRDGKAPPVIEARDVLSDPEGMLKTLCVALGVTFNPAMLAWQPGLRDSDGVWARHWYGRVEDSTGFAAPTPAKQPAEELMPIVEQCQPAYERLRAHKLIAAEVD